MELSYYPGCSLHGTSEEYDHSIKVVCGALDVKLSELDDWTCCGASSAHALNDDLADLLAARNLVLAEVSGKDVLVPCAACYSRLKFAEKSGTKNIPGMAGGGGKPVDVLHIHDFFAQPEMLSVLAQKMKKPLDGLKVVPYYGCLTVRPPKITDSQSPENPAALDEILEAMGAEVTRWPFKTDCCGGSFSLSKPEVVVKLSGDLMEAAQKAGGDLIVTDCPMCQANLDTRQAEIEAERNITLGMPVLFITELMALAMGEPKVGSWLSRHIVDPTPKLRERGLI